MKKHLMIITITVTLLALIFTGCNSNKTDIEKPTESAIPSVTPTKEVTTANIAGLKGPTSMGMIRMFAEVNSLSEYVQVKFDIYNSPDVITTGLLNGDIDIAAIPTNLAASLYNKTDGQIVLLGVNTLGVLDILALDNADIKSISDLKGKTIIASGKGSTPEYILNYILEKNNIDPINDVNIIYKSEHSEVAALITAGKADIVMLPQPFVTTVTMKNEKIKVVIDLTNEWNKVAPENSELMMGCLVATKKFADKYADELTSLMMLNLESVNWVNANQEAAAQFIVKFKVLPSEDIAIKAISKSNLVFIFAQQAKKQLNEYYKILFDYNSKSIGGAIPKENFYFGQ